MRIEVYPSYSLYIQLHEFHGIDLVHGYYQVRFRVRSHADVQIESSSSSSVGRNGAGGGGGEVYEKTAVSRGIKIAFNEQSVALGDEFSCKVSLKKRFERMESTCLHIQFELWYMDPEQKQSAEQFTFMSKRVVMVRLHPEAGTHCHRAVFFEYFSFSAVSLTVHACVTELITVRTKVNPPNVPLNDKLRKYHRQVCLRLLYNVVSLQNFFRRYGNVLSSPLYINPTDVETEYKVLQKALEEDRRPWDAFVEHVDQLGARLTQMFTQLVQLFGHCRALNAQLLESVDQQRIKKFAEGFLFSEDTVHSLLHPALNSSGRIFDLIRKDGFLFKLPPLPVMVDGTDVDAANVSLVVEQRFLPAGATLFSRPSIPLSMHSESCLQQIPAIHTVQALHDGDSLAVSSAREPVSLAEARRAQQPAVAKKKTLSMERLHSVAGFCLPVSRQLEESYEAPHKHLLDPADSRLAHRRMTDPGDVPNGFQEPLLKHSDSAENGRPPLKSFSVGESMDDNRNNPPSTSTNSSSSDSLSRNGTTPASDSLDESLKLRFIDHARVEFNFAKEAFKRKLHQAGYRGNLYSDQNYFADRKAYFSDAFNAAIESRNIEKVHLVVFVHGLEGTSEDLTTYRNYLRIALPEVNFAFLLSEVNQSETWSDLSRMAENLLNEITRYVDRLPRLPEKISMIAHSLGGLIVRTMCGLPGMKRFTPRLHTLLTLNSPHCGLLYNQRAASWGISLLQWWKQSVSLEQLTMRDALHFQDTFLYRLSKNGAFGLFRHVLLVGSHLDLYVPAHSALVETCKAAAQDPSAQGTSFHELLSHINESVVASPKHTVLVKYTVAHSLANVSRAQQMTGRPTHIAVVDDDTFVEKLMTVSAANYFR